MPNEFSKFRWNDHPVRVALKDTASDLATIYFNRANMDGTEVFGKQEKLAADLGVSVRTIRRAQNQLERAGLIRLVRRGSSYGNSSNKYELTMPETSPDTEADRTSGSSPDIGDHLTGHGCPTSPDTGVRLIDPSNKPRGNKPRGTSERKADTDMSAEPDKASIFDDRPDASRPVGEGQEESEPSPRGSVSSIEGSDPQESEPALGAVSSSTASTPSGVHQPDTVGVSGINRTSGMSGVADEPSTEGEPNRMARHTFDPFAPQPATATDDSDYYGALADAHYASMRRTEPATVPAVPDPFAAQPPAKPRQAVGRPFAMAPNAFVGPETDPATGGPNWDQGPLQRP